MRKRRFSDIFRGYRIGTFVEDWLILTYKTYELPSLIVPDVICWRDSQSQVYRGISITYKFFDI